MGNGSKAPAIIDRRVYHIADSGDGHLAVVKGENLEVVGYMVPQGFAALFQLFYGYAPKVQALHNLPSPTEDQVKEAVKRYLKKMGGKVKELVAEAILEVMKSDDWLKHPEIPWDFEQELIPENERKRRERVITMTGVSKYPKRSKNEAPEDKPTTAESEDDNDKEEPDDGDPDIS